MRQQVRVVLRRWLLVAFGAACVPSLALAGDTSGQKAQSGMSGATAEMDVEELRDDLPQHEGQTVRVVGEVEEKLGRAGFVLESGGIFDDEIAVVIPKDAKGLDATKLRDDDKLVVTGDAKGRDS